MKLLSFHPTTHLITLTRTTHQFFSSIQYLFLHPISCLGWKKLFFSSTIHKQKSHNKLLIYKNNVFFIQFQFWMKLIPTQRRRTTRIMLDLSYLLPFSLIALYFKPLLLFLVHFFHPPQVDIPSSSPNWLDETNLFSKWVRIENSSLIFSLILGPCLSFIMAFHKHTNLCQWKN